MIKSESAYQKTVERLKADKEFIVSEKNVLRN